MNLSLQSSVQVQGTGYALSKFAGVLLLCWFAYSLVWGQVSTSLLGTDSLGPDSLRYTWLVNAGSAAAPVTDVTGCTFYLEVNAASNGITLAPEARTSSWLFTPTNTSLSAEVVSTGPGKTVFKIIGVRGDQLLQSGYGELIVVQVDAGIGITVEVMPEKREHSFLKPMVFADQVRLGRTFFEVEAPGKIAEVLIYGGGGLRMKARHYAADGLHGVIPLQKPLEPGSYVLVIHQTNGTVRSKKVWLTP